MAPTTTTARETARRLLPWRFVIALLACTFLWGVASVAALASAAQGQSQPAASSPKPADDKTTAKTPEQQKPTNRFGSIDDEDQKPAEARPSTAKPAPKPVNRFGSIDQEDQKPAPSKPASAQAPPQKSKNRFASVAEEEAQKPAKPATRLAPKTSPRTSSPKPANRLATLDEPGGTPAGAKPATAQPAAVDVAPAAAQPTPVAQPAPAKNRFATVNEEDEQAKPAAQPAPAPAAAQPAATPKNRFAVVEEEEPAQKAAEPQAEGQQKSAPKNRFAFDEEDIPEPPKEKLFTYTGTRKCSRCHMKQLNAYRNGPHGRHWDDRTPAADLGCETCHGPGQAHDDFPAEKDLVRTFTRIAPREASAFCLKCHSRDKHTEWTSGMHEARNVTCINCHSIHQPKSEKGLLKAVDVVSTCAPCHRDKAAKMQRSSHMPVREGKMDCASCHSVHGSTNVKLLTAGNTVNEACMKCHAEKRGPYLWEHAPVVENCTTCHDAHGSWNERMLVAKSAMLCQRCHIGTRHTATPYDGAALNARSNRLVNRGCVNCHSMVHGSNHPSGRFLAR